jgi:hypothetical protein
MANEDSGDPFDVVLNLEDQYYQEGFQAGIEDGSRAGLIEGRIFGLEKGFEKFFEMGKLNGRACVWSARMQTGKDSSEQSLNAGDEASNVGGVKSLRYNERLDKHVQTLRALSELESLSTQNTEDAVSEFDDRFKRATAKAKVIESIIGEEHVDGNSQKLDIAERKGGEKSEKGRIKLARSGNVVERNIEDFGIK